MKILYHIEMKKNKNKTHPEVQDNCLIPWNSIYKMKIRPKTHRPIYNPVVAL